MTTSNQLAVSPVTMSSLDLLVVINEVRKDNGKPTLPHKNLLKKVESHPGIQPAKFLAGYIDEKGETRKFYNLPRRECDLLVMSESLAIQAQVYDRLIKELGEKETQQLTNAEVKRIERDYHENLKHSPEYEVGAALITAVRHADEDGEGILHQALEGIDFESAEKSSGIPAHRIKAMTLDRLRAERFVGGIRRGEHEHSDGVLDVFSLTRAVIDHRKAGERLEALRRAKPKVPMTHDEIIAYDLSHKHDKPVMKWGTK